MAAAKAEDSGKTIREIVQKKFLEEVIGFGGNWKVLVMDRASTKVMSAACTMFDIMERRVTLVENLANKRQPFPEMDVVYFITPTEASVRMMLADFENPKKPSYGNVHIIFTDTIGNDVMASIQANGNFVARIKTFKEINIDFLVLESSLYCLDLPEALPKIYGALPDPAIPAVIGKRLANVCISLNEHPSIRFQGNSAIAREIATAMNSAIQAYKHKNTSYWTYGDDARQERERGQFLILDRSFDAVTPLMHEYTYQSMVYDLLPVENNVLKYKSETGKGSVEKEALLGEQDEVWVELRNSHIAKVIEVISERMKEILQNSSGAKLTKKSGADMDVSEMAAAVKQLPEYQQTMSRWGAHTSISSQCMSAFTKDHVLELSNIEQLATTGSFIDNDDDGALKQLKPNEIFQKVLETVGTLPSKAAKVRLVAIWWIAQKSATEDQKRQLVQASGLTGQEQQLFLNFARLGANSITLAPATAAAAPKSGGVFSSMFGGNKSKSAAAESETLNSRHIPQLKIILEQLNSGDLPVASFPTMGPAMPVKDGKSAAKSVRKFGANNRWGSKAESAFDGGRFLVFVAGGLAYSEIRSAHEVSLAQKKEVIIGSTSVITPSSYIETVEHLAASSVTPPRP